MTKESPAAYRITDLSTSDRPRERLAELGAQALANAELIAILLGVGIHGENAVEMGQRLLRASAGGSCSSTSTPRAGAWASK